MVEAQPILACVAGLEAAVFGAETHPGAPVVFVTAWRGGAAVSLYDQCRTLVDAGFIAVILDNRNHGRRVVDAACNEGWSLHHAANMYGIMVGSALDISLTIDMLPARLGIATDRVGVTGISLGGHITLLAMANDPRIAVGAALIGGGDYRALMMRRAVENGCPPEDFSAYYPDALQRAVERYDPIQYPARFADRPLLLANGTDDTLVPIDCNYRLEAACRPHYTYGDRLRLSAYAGVGHAVPPEMMAESIAWLTRWLLGDTTSG